MYCKVTAAWRLCAWKCFGERGPSSVHGFTGGNFSNKMKLSAMYVFIYKRISLSINNFELCCKSCEYLTNKSDKRRLENNLSNFNIFIEDKTCDSKGRGLVKRSASFDIMY